MAGRRQATWSDVGGVGGTQGWEYQPKEVRRRPQLAHVVSRHGTQLGRFRLTVYVVHVRPAFWLVSW